jgi:glycosyltransferase involved in cell wall biosynthesis
MSLRVCYFGTYRAEYARNQILIEGLRRAGVEVVECHAALWQGVEDRVRTASGGWKKPSFWGRVINAYAQLLRQYRRVSEYDVLVIGYPGHFDVFLGRLLSSLRRKPLVWDVLNSLYLITSERGIQERSPLTVNLIRRVEKLALRLPDMLILDTSQFVEWFCQTHQISPDRFRLVQIGADERYFQPMETPPHQAGDDEFRVIYYGSYIPNHGVTTIIEAARLLIDEPIIFEMVGSGPDQPKAQSLAKEYGLDKVHFIEWLNRPELAQHIAQADVVLGVFGLTQQNLLTNNNKIYEGFAMRKPVISARTPALPDSLQHGVHLYLCERGDPASLAEAIRALRADPILCQRLAEKGYQLFLTAFDVTHIGEQFAALLQELVEKRQAA